MEGWKFTLTVTLLAFALGVAGAPTWLVYGAVLALIVVSLPRLLSEPTPEVPDRRAGLRVIGSEWLVRGVFVSLLAVAAGIIWLAVAATVLPLALVLLTRPQNDR